MFGASGVHSTAGSLKRNFVHERYSNSLSLSLHPKIWSEFGAIVESLLKRVFCMFGAVLIPLFVAGIDFRSLLDHIFFFIR